MHILGLKEAIWNTIFSIFERRRGPKCSGPRKTFPLSPLSTGLAARSPSRLERGTPTPFRFLPIQWKNRSCATVSVTNSTVCCTSTPHYSNRLCSDRCYSDSPCTVWTSGGWLQLNRPAGSTDWKTPNQIPKIRGSTIVGSTGSVYFAECGLRNFYQVYFAEILMRNVPQIIRCSNSAFRNPHSAKYSFTNHDMQGKTRSL